MKPNLRFYESVPGWCASLMIYVCKSDDISYYSQSQSSLPQSAALLKKKKKIIQIVDANFNYLFTFESNGGNHNLDLIDD